MIEADSLMYYLQNFSNACLGIGISIGNISFDEILGVMERQPEQVYRQLSKRELQS